MKKISSRSIQLLLSAALLFLAGTAQAFDECGCYAGLAKTILKDESSSSSKIAYLRSIDEKTFEKLRSSVGVEGELFEIIKVSLSYDDFEERRRTYLETIQWEASAEQARSFVLQTTDTSAWSGCMQTCITKSTGFHCAEYAQSSTDVSVRCSWRPGPGVQESKQAVSVEQNGDKIKSFDIPRNSYRDVPLKRDQKKKEIFVFTPNTDNSDTVVIEKTPDQPKFDPRKLLASCRYRGQSAALNSWEIWGPAGLPCHQPAGWGYYEKSPRIPPRVCSCKDRDGVTHWGPQGVPCLLGGSSTTYSANCQAYGTYCPGGAGGNIWGGGNLWGPKGERTGGFPGWETFGARGDCVNN